ncbi:protein RDM16-like isoform X1 [Cucurbita pepo subsp. pepo]|uniref:protein RDM16-like isoform X1 n=2 Tax=Cucurbita pepo subsp. pepo TaxID=3664 RepID=UPI000C9D28CD|nr:protein RDM16-like isoform X1 [Cucurbita pepo subsp. pepo]
MDRVSEKEKSSKRSREERDRDHKHRSRDAEEKHFSKDEKHRESDHHHRRRHHRSDRDSKRERSHEPRDHKHRRERSYDHREDRERSRDRDSSKRERSNEPRGVREGSEGRGKLREVRHEQSDNDHEQEGSFEPTQNSVRSNKRKERGGSEDRFDGGEKKARASEDGKDLRRIEDGNEVNGAETDAKKERRRLADDEKDGEANLSGRGRRERKRFEDRVEEEDNGGNAEDGKVQFGGTIDDKGSLGNGAMVEPINMSSASVPQNFLHHSHPLPIKVSSISTTNENKGVSITRSHEVHGKSSTDGTSSNAGKSGNLSLDALAKAKKALQMQKELAEKLKKIPLMKKVGGSSSASSSVVKSEEKAKPGVLGQSTTTNNATTLSIGVASSSSTLPTAASALDGGINVLAGLTSIPHFEAVKRAQELAARMGFRQDPEFAPLINLFPGNTATDVAVPQKLVKAPVLCLDALGREIDEQGNVVNITKPSNLSTLKVNINKQKKDAFQILKPELDVDPDSNPHFDERMGINKTKLLRPKRMSFQFVEEGKWSKEAETIKLRSKFGEAQAKERKEKQAQLAKAKAAPDINPNLIEVSERVMVKEKTKEPIPEIEWWDVPLLHSGTYEDVGDGVVANEKLRKDKITIYVEHPRPIEPPAEPAPPPPQPLKLTKKEQKKLRTQRRLAKEKDRQEMIRQGLIEPPKPKVKMSNLMKVLGSEATQDPTKLEKEIRAAAAEREQAHIDRNVARKLTPAERREKKERKLFDDSSSLETIVSVYKINDLSHPQARFKVDVNARENRLSGCAVICDGISVLFVEGGSKSIKRYGKLMLRRINWADSVKEEDEEEEHEDKPVNKCSLVWQGSVAKSSFNRFSIHECMTEAAARKIFADAGVGHYWDLAVNFSDDQI